MKDLVVTIMTKTKEKNIRKCIASFQECVRRFVIVYRFSARWRIFVRKLILSEEYLVLVRGFARINGYLVILVKLGL